MCCARASILHVLLAAGPEPAAGDPSGPSGPGFCSMNLMAAAEHPWVSRRKARAGEAVRWQFPGSERDQNASLKPLSSLAALACPLRAMQRAG